MRLVAPLGLLAGLLAVPLVVLYLLRSRRPRVAVASTFLWSGSDRAVAAAVPWQRFRPDRTFWLVLAAVLVGAVALARPAVDVLTTLGDHTVLIVDASASMGADEGGRTRLDLARAEAEALLADLGTGQTVSVVEARATARVVLSGSADPAAVARALRAITPSQGPADLADALTLAAALERPGQRTVVHLLSDGVLPEEVAAVAPADLRLHAVGEDRPNLAVSRLEAVATGGGSGQAFVQVRNLGLVPAGAVLRLEVDGGLLVAERLDLGPRERRDVVLPLAVPTGAGEVRASVAPAGPAPSGQPAADALAVDDTAHATLAGTRQVNALVVGEENLFLTAALGAVEGVDVRTATAVPERLEGIDLLVVDRAPPPEGPLRVPTLFVAPAGQPAGVTADGGPVALPSLTYQAAEHPLLADVDLAGTAVAEVQPVASPALETLAGGPSGPLLLAGRLDGVPVVHLPFDLLRSNLPLQVAWPVLVANAVSWLTAPPITAPLAVGAEARFAVPGGATGVVVTAPSGAETTLDAARPRVVVDEAGLWTAAWAGPEDVVATLPPPPAVAVNVPGEESDLARERPVDSGAPMGGEAAAELGPGQRIAGRELLAGVFVLLLASWALPHRGARRRGTGGGRGRHRLRLPHPRLRRGARRPA